ncbi:hypothetical protein X759_35695 [Mesorhizobium sp. LSHC420B00]|nr:hypothetical protein X759_35695 [Mesorhizobium sp. LSHC420B00]
MDTSRLQALDILLRDTAHLRTRADEIGCEFNQKGHLVALRS